MLYSKSTNGFYDTNINIDIPVDAKEISPELHSLLMAGQGLGKRIIGDDNGFPVLADPPQPPVETLTYLARTKRDTLLSESDWTVLPDSPVSTEAQTAWKQYRQSLRDVPSQNGFPVDIYWPVPPTQ